MLCYIIVVVFFVVVCDGVYVYVCNGLFNGDEV